MKPDVRDRLVLPLLIPLGILLVIAAIAGIFGMILFFNPITVSLTIATVVAGGILAAFALATSARPDELNGLKRAAIGFMVVGPLLVGGLVATNVIQTDAEKVAERECHFCIPEGAVRIVARGIEFDLDSLEIPSEDAKIFFINEDSGIDHNVAIYESEEAENEIFVGEIFPGVESILYEVGDILPGEYFFRCDVHPTTMVGTAFVVREPAE